MREVSGILLTSTVMNCARFRVHLLKATIFDERANYLDATRAMNPVMNLVMSLVMRWS